MRNINFILKFVLAFFLFMFALWYNHSLYNIIVSFTLISILIKENISPFRFPRQAFVFSIFLIIIFTFQSFNGYGKILLNLPLHLTVTDEGISMALRFVTQILLIFLLFGAAIYSSKKDEILYYLKKPEKSHGIVGQTVERFLRMGIFSFYMVPKSLKVQGQFSEQIRSNPQIQSARIKQKVKVILDHIYGFLYAIIKSAEKEYPEFVIQNKKKNDFNPLPLVTIRNGLIFFILMFIHGFLVWKF